MSEIGPWKREIHSEPLVLPQPLTQPLPMPDPQPKPIEIEEPVTPGVDR
jgi:hypothetical protein